MERKRLITLSAAAMATPIAVAASLLLGLGSSVSLADILAGSGDVLAQRSPGERVSGALTNTKNERVKSLVQKLADSVTGPQERVLAAINERPDVPLGDAIPGAFDGLPADVLGDPGTSSALPALSAPSPFTGIPTALPALGGANPATGGGGGAGTPTDTPTATPTGTPTGTPTDTPTTVPTGTPTGTPTDTPTVTPTDPGNPVPAVPEPSTWLMMIVGFLAMGHALRRGQRRAQVFRSLPGA